MLTLNDLKKTGSATLEELDEVGYKRKFKLGRNEWGFDIIVIIDNDNSQWNYDGEQDIFTFQRKANENFLIQV